MADMRQMAKLPRCSELTGWDYSAIKF